MHCLSSSSQQPCEIETLVVPILHIRTSRHSEAKQLIYFSVVGWHSNPGWSACLPPSIDLTRLSDRTRISQLPNCSSEDLPLWVLKFGLRNLTLLPAVLSSAISRKRGMCHPREQSRNQETRVLVAGLALADSAATVRFLGLDFQTWETRGLVWMISKTISSSVNP